MSKNTLNTSSLNKYALKIAHIWQISILKGRKEILETSLPFLVARKSVSWVEWFRMKATVGFNLIFVPT